jgi:hypothetical protein
LQTRILGLPLFKPKACHENMDASEPEFGAPMNRI